jgi:transposase InsO family protein
MWMLLQDEEYWPGFNVTSTMVEQVYSECGFWLWQLADQEETIRPPYEAAEVNLIWHTDLHQYSVTKEWMIAFIDDSSRRLMGWDFVADKASATQEEVLRRIIDETGQQPYALWSDNGTEFQGTFRDYLEEHHVVPVYTHPYTPQQNGKIERFWRTVERCKIPSGMAHHMERYNQIPHLGLPYLDPDPAKPRRGRRRMKPAEAYDQLERYAGLPAVGHWRVGWDMMEFEPHPPRERASRR